MSSNFKKALICDFPISVNSLYDNFEMILENIKQNKGQWIVTLNLEMIYRAQKKESYRRLLDSADIFIADGVPLIWASKFKKNVNPIAGRSNGTDLVEQFLKSNLDFAIGVIGGTNPSKTIEKYNSNHLQDSFTYYGIINIDDERKINGLIDKIKEHEIKLLFLSLGVPKQDFFAKRIKDEISPITVIGVGGAFDLLSGRKSRAPGWMQRNGLEWLHRLITEPKRLWKRYLINYPRACYYLIKDIVKANN